MKLLCRRAGVASVLLAAALLMVPAPAFAGDGGHLLVDVPGDGAGFVAGTSAPLIHALRLAPGYGASGDLILKNDSESAARLVLEVVDVADDDNGCNGPETRDGDTTCGAGGGEIGSWLVVTVDREIDGSLRQIWKGKFADLEAGVELPDDMPAGATWPMRLGVELSRAATNETQSDRVAFGVRWAAAADVMGGAAQSPAEVLGVEAFAPGAGPAQTVIGGGHSGVPLPFTGAEIGWPLVLADAALLSAGFVLLYRARRAPR